MTKYKLTDQKMQTHGGFQWKLGKWYEAKGNINQPLCTDRWLHCYDSPLLAVLHNPIHSNFSNPRLFEVEVAGETKDDHGLKCGYRKMRLVKELPLPDITPDQKLAYWILCTKEVYKDKGWNAWADRWLSGKERNGTWVALYDNRPKSIACTDAAAYIAYVDAYAAATIKNISLHSIAERAMKY